MRTKQPTGSHNFFDQMKATQLRNNSQVKTTGAREDISSGRIAEKCQVEQGRPLLDTSEISVLERREAKLPIKYRVAMAYRKAGHERKAQNVLACSAKITLEQTTCVHGKQKIQTNYTCKDRLCPICARKAAQKKGHEYALRIQHEYDQGKFKYAYMVTLTYENVFALTDKGYSQYCREVKQFRQAISETFDVYGGLVAFETTISRESGPPKFHPHFHLLILSNRALGTKTNKAGETSLNYRWLNYISRTWSEINGNTGYVVDARPFDFSDVNEVVKYTCKGIESMSSEMLTDFIAFSYKRRFLIAFGGIYGKGLRSVEQDETDDTLTCDKCGCTETFIVSMVVNGRGNKYVLDMPSNVYWMNQVKRE